MKDQVVNLLFTGFMVGLIVGFAISIFITMNYYKSGQIDALTGKVAYELVVHPEKTSFWEAIDKK